MNPKRRSVGLWLLMLMVWLPRLSAQEVDPVLLDDVSKTVPKAVTAAPEAKLAPPKKAESTKQVLLETVLVEIKLDQLPAVKDETSKHERLKALAQTLKWKELRPGLDWMAPQEFKLQAEDGPLGKHGNCLARPTIVTLDGQEAKFFSGGEIAISDSKQPDKAIAFRPFGIGMTCTPNVRGSDRVRLDLKFEHTKVTHAPGTTRDAARMLSDLARLINDTDAVTESKTLDVPPVVSGQMVSLTADMAFGDSYLIALPSQNDPANKVVLFGITPNAVAKGTLAQGPSNVLPQPKAMTGKGINSDARVTGHVVLHDRATETKLEAQSVSIDVTEVTLSHGVSRAKPVALIAANEHDDVRVLLPRATLLVAKNMQVKNGRQTGTVTLGVQGFVDADAIKNAMQRKDGEALMLIVLPTDEPLTQDVVLRTLEHDLARSEFEQINQKRDQDMTHLIDVVAGQKSVRVPIKHETFLLLPTPTGNLEGMQYVSQVRSDKPTVKQVGGLTVLFVSESCFELERLVRELEPTSNITVIEVRDAVLVRGTVSDEEQRRSLLEIAEQFYPKVLDQLRVETTSPSGLPRRKDASQATPVEPVPIAASGSESVLPPGQARRSSASLPSPVQHVMAEQLAKTDEATGKKDDTDAAVSALRGRRLTRLAPHKLPSVEELKELRDDVQALRRDVQRVSEQLERDRKESKARAEDETRRIAVPGRRESAANSPREEMSNNRNHVPQPTTEALKQAPRWNGPANAAMAHDEIHSIAWHALGVRLEPLSDAQREKLNGKPFRGGLAVVDVRGPDLTHGLRPGDILVGVERWETTSLRDLEYVLTRDDSVEAKSLKYFVVRNHDVQTGVVVPGEGADRRRTGLLNQLDRTINLKVNGTLEGAVQQLQKAAGINVVVDKEGLEEEGLTAREEVRVEYSDLSVKSALSLLLESVSDRLGWVVENDAVKVTSKVRTLGTLVTKTYPVADLIVAMPENRGPLNLNGEWKPAADVKAAPPLAAAKKQQSANALIKLLTETMEPDSWSEVGGEGSIQFHEGTLSLVIRQRAAVHEAIGELLQQLRRLQDLQVSVEMRLMSVSETVAKQVGKDTEQVLSANKVQRLIERSEQDRHSNTLVLPKVTLFNGQSMQMQHEGDQQHPNLSLQFTATASADRKAVRLGFDIGESFEKLTRHSGETLKDGESLLLDVTSEFTRTGQLLRQLPIGGDTEQARQLARQLHPGLKGRYVLLVTPRVIEVEEEEELVGR